jgi:protein-S-isoprenylcysteine O-methyltransferase Ste14
VTGPPGHSDPGAGPAGCTSQKGALAMNETTIAWLNVAVMVVCSAVFSVLYVMSVHPVRLGQRIGEKAYRRCGTYRIAASFFMFIPMANYIIYRFYPLPISPLPEHFPWPYSVNIIVVIFFGIPAMVVFVWGILDAGTETLFPNKSHTMYKGIYQHIRHPQALGEAPMWLAVALLLNSPFLSIYSLLFLLVWYWWCLEEEKDLLLRYGDSYAEYRTRTGMFFPRRQRPA